MLKIAPVNQSWASLLFDLLGKTPRIYMPNIPENEIEALLERWNPNLQSENYRSIRNKIGGLIKYIPHFYSEQFELLKDHADVALRQSYYNRFHCEKVSELEAFYEKDGEDFISAALWNVNLFKTEELRNWLESTAHGFHHMLYSAAKQCVEESYPDWFNTSSEAS